jgi:hypothetical protein
VQITGFDPTQVPAWHLSVCVQALPSLHVVPSGDLPSAGQLAELPVQLSATSQAPVDARQTVEDGAKWSAGQVALDPVQVSATSQTPAAARQTAPALPTGCWQVTVVPSH